MCIRDRFCNGCYRTNYYSNEIMASYYTSMLTRARSMEGYTCLLYTSQIQNIWILIIQKPIQS